MKQSIKEKEVRNFINKELGSIALRGALLESGPIKYWNSYKRSFAIKYDCLYMSAINAIMHKVQKSPYANIIKVSVSTNMCHGFNGVVCNVKRADVM